MHNDSHDMHTTGAFIHGCLVMLHLIGVLYNAKRRNKADVVVHTLALAYSVRSMLHHTYACRGCER